MSDSPLAQPQASSSEAGNGSTNQKPRRRNQWRNRASTQSTKSQPATDNPESQDPCNLNSADLLEANRTKSGRRGQNSRPNRGREQGGARNGQDLLEPHNDTHTREEPEIHPNSLTRRDHNKGPKRGVEQHRTRYTHSTVVSSNPSLPSLDDSMPNAQDQAKQAHSRRGQRGGYINSNSFNNRPLGRAPLTVASHANFQLRPPRPSAFDTSTLNPDAQPFVPRHVAAPSVPRRFSPNSRVGGSRGNRQQFNTGRRTYSNSSKIAPQRAQRNINNESDKPLRERLIDDLEDDKYECMICCQVILARQGIWTCKTCYHMFHITGRCIVDWAKKSKGDDNTWSCPMCNSKNETIPYNYYCFCGKDRNPITQMGDTPHSCGRVCGGARGPGCPHPCSEPCHPGPCVECPVMIVKTCNCGATEQAVRCGTEVRVTCNRVCGKNLACGVHTCTQICHDGNCHPCDVIVKQECYGGHETREIVCSQQGKDFGKYSCDIPCDGRYKCGKHLCDNRCHSKSTDCGSCPMSPERISRCPCGRNSLKELGVERLSCEDDVPVCEAVCDKVLECGSADKPHRCRNKCHSGPCPPCDYNSSIICRCTQLKRTLPCVDYVKLKENGEVFTCERTCKSKMSCGFHKCMEKCCVLQDHFCLRACNKRLACGQHLCENICHAGQCPRCLNASFDEQFCHCGRTMRPPPVPCGAALPHCEEPCARPHSCNHPVLHSCHGDERCPPCTYLVERWCYGKHEIRKNIPCHFDAMSCGRICNKPLPCGSHSCTRNCHFGECVEEGETCVKPCTIVRNPCEHPCAMPCHSTQPCPESQCSYLVDVMCDCGRRKSKMKCYEVEKSMSRLRAVLAEAAITAVPLPMTTLKKSPSMEQLSCMTCNDDCKKVARNKKLADALCIVTNDDGDSDDPTVTFTETMKTEYRGSPQFVGEIENVFIKLLDVLRDATNCSNVMSHSFRPMPMEKRRFVHEYASFFHMETISVDPAPKRSVIVSAKRGVARSPLILLSDLVKYQSVLKAPGPTTLRHNINDEIKKNAALAAAADADTNGDTKLKALRTDKKAYKRVAPSVTVSKPAPLTQKNAFDLLGSDDEESNPRGRAISNGADEVVGSVERDIDWWSEEEANGSTNPANEDVLPSAVDNNMCSPRVNVVEEYSSIRDSWCDED